MIDIRKILILAGFFLSPISHGHAMSLLDAYEAALQHDPTYRSAYHENEAGQQAEAIGLASLLPNLSITHTQNKSSGTITGKTQTGQSVSDVVTFDSQISSLTLRQPLINLEAVASYRIGKAQADSSRAKFTGRSQQLIVRLVEAYVETLLAQDHVKLVEAQLVSLEELKRVNERMLIKGEGTTTDVLETQSKHAIAQARVIEANDELEGAQLKLEAIIGQKINQLDRLSDAFNTRAIQLQDYDNWYALALERNAELVTQRHAVTSGKEEIRKSFAGHTPRVDLVASLSKNNRGSFITRNQDAELGTIGVEVNFPLYAGGRVNALTAQAKANHARAEADLDAVTDKVLVELKKQYNLLKSGIKKIESLELAVKSAELLVDATEKSIRGGIRINLNLLDAQQQLYTAQRDLSRARFDYLLAYLRLQLAAGTLVLDDLRNIASYFKTSLR
ncbi:outer membrane protein, protease secretion system [Nitrosomonas oligotropha]|uniref:Outer membrane protein, protease secretion system n=2 Tax=Nitrosomonas oligotropha TaxID=42354 RepID=A0A1H8NY39_9PROT|nr:outer membrane protein, protease secretion system [Nitrosomonas oligotropha]SEO34569.1 outer membrane protein, protease secretion system [Nitrosomonas oligotropha]